jgi:hypothetical protein
MAGRLQWGRGKKGIGPRRLPAAEGIWRGEAVRWLLRCRLALLALLLLVPSSLLAENAPLTIHYFRAEGCPHCGDAGAFLAELASREPRLMVREYEVKNDPGNRALFAATVRALAIREPGVPFILIGDWVTVGFDSVETTGLEIRHHVGRCLDQGCPDLLVAVQEGQTATLASGPGTAGLAGVRLPLLGEINPASLSLPLLTLALAGMDAFNPCAFFVLLFLLSMMAHQKSRRRMLLVGGVFVFFSGLMYFAFMSAWLSLFLLLGQVAWVTLGAGLLALLVGGLNIKDFFFFQQGPSLSIPESKKPDIFRRARAILAAESLPAMLAATIFLAIAANFYELLCTAGFPMVYTRILTLNEPSAAIRYLYLAGYNLIYVLPLAAIVVIFTRTLGARKLSEREGRLLKLLSGVMMFELGLVLLLVPDWLNRIGVAFALLAAAVLLTFVAARVTRAGR